MRQSLTILILLALPSLALAGRGNDLVHAKLLVDTANPTPNQTFHLGVLFDIEPGWHIYWKNPGDSGLPTKLKLLLPPGYIAGNVHFPLPAKLTLPGDIVNYAYENQAMLIVPITAPATVGPGDTFKVDASWLVCRDVCLPGKTSLSMAAGDATAVKPELIANALAKLPVDDDPSVLDLKIKADAKSAAITVLWKRAAPSDIQFFPPPAPGFEIGSITCETKAGETTIHYQATATEPSSLPVPTDGLLEFTVAGGRRAGLNLTTSP